MIDQRTIAVALVAAVVGSAVGAGAVATLGGPGAPGPDDAGADPVTDRPGRLGPGDDADRDDLAAAEVAQFDSREEFENYVQQSSGSASPYLFGSPFRRSVYFVGDVETTAQRSAGAPSGDAGGGGGGDAPDRVSDTNVQEQGIDEPDVLKTNGEVVYYTSAGPYGRKTQYETKVVDASDPANPALVGSIPEEGNMLLTDDTLVVIAHDRVVGYDVTDPEDPERRWSKELNASVVTARLYQGTVYLVTRSGIDLNRPCPVRPFGGDGPSIRCDQIYHPTRPVEAQTTYTTMQMDPGSGEVTDSVSVVGSSQHAATYVSENAVYLTYTRRASNYELYSTFLLTNKSDLLDRQTAERIRELREMNISTQAKRVELGVIVQRWFARMDPDRREEVRKEVSGDFQAYLDDHKRQLVRTGIVEIGIGDGLSVEATGEVPGYPLNQFSMDEGDSGLRIATTVGRQWGGEPENDLYTLDEDLEIQGSVTGMAPNERIYSVRYVGDTAYLVTFRRVDPFHVVDLSDPQNPEELGQVELPGFSRYLHPLGEDRILGVGEEDGKVKAVVFDVSDPSEPKVQDSLILDDRWSAVSQTHHAFLQDRKHGVFFLPGSRGGYVIDYTGEELSVEKRVDTDGRATRAMYLNDYLYVFGRHDLVVVDESDWSTETTLDLRTGDAETERVRPIPTVAR